MKRRDFLTNACAAGVAAGTLGHMTASSAAADDSDAKQNQWIELRTYFCADADKQAALLKVLGEAAVPAWNRVGIKPVGVLVAKPEDNNGIKNVDIESLPNQVFVILPHNSAESVLTANRKLLADPQYVKDAAALLEAPFRDPLYTRYESSLFTAFDACPKVEVPTLAEGRVLQMRIYESHNELKAEKKVHMFNNGEMEIFRRVGMDPVLFGEELIGPLMPNLTYMLSFDDMAAKEAAWKAFLADPAWDKIKSEPMYKETVSRITNIMLRPAAGSQI